jgi:hypothetical protein
MLEHCRTSRDDLLDDRGLTKLTPHTQSVSDVILDAVALGEDGRDTTLRIARVPLPRLALGQDRHRAPRIGCRKGRDPTSGPAPHHDQVEGV